MTEKIHLLVPYRDRHRAKALGACWDASERQWYVLADQDLSVFRPWMSVQHSIRMRLKKPYLLTRYVDCPCCHTDAKVYCLGTQDFEIVSSGVKHRGFYTLYHITHLPKRFYTMLNARCLTYLMGEGYAGSSRLENHCLCGAALEDTLLHRLGSQSFRPHVPEQAGDIACEALNIPLAGLVYGQWRLNSLLLDCIKKIASESGE